MLVLVLQIVTGIFLDDALQAGCGAGIRLGRIHHARCAVGLAGALHALDRRIGLFHRHLPAHVPRTHVRLYRKPRELIWLFGFHLPVLMAEAFFGYLLPWGQMSYWGAQVIVNLFRRDPADRPGPFAVDPRRLRRLRRDAQPLFRVPRDRHSARAARAGRGAPDGAARSRLEQSGRGRNQGDSGADGHPLDGIPFHPYYTVKDPFGVCVPRDFLDRSCSSCRNSAATSWNTTTSSLPIR